MLVPTFICPEIQWAAAKPNSLRTTSGRRDEGLPGFDRGQQPQERLAGMYRAAENVVVRGQHCFVYNFVL